MARQSTLGSPTLYSRLRQLRLYSLCTCRFLSPSCRTSHAALSIPNLRPPPLTHTPATPTTGLVQSSFFYGYLISQLPGGWLAARLGGRRVLPIAVALFSAATAGVPFLAGTLLGLCAARAAVGLGEAVAPSCATEMIARAVPVAGRSRATAAVFSGLHVGALVGLLAAPPLIAAGGWRAVFYVFGGAGLVWCLGWEALLARLQRQDPAMVALLDGSRGPRPVRRTGAGARISPPASASAPAPATPWRAFLSNRPLQALAFAHFCNNWFHYVMLAWLPTYFTDRLALDLDGAARFALLPPLAAIAVSFAAGKMEWGGSRVVSFLGGNV